MWPVQASLPEAGLLALHGAKEFSVVLKAFEFLNNKFCSTLIFHIVKQFTQNPDTLEF